MSVAFANVTDITIPQGNVTKITETATGRVLWEKKRPLSAHWEWIYFTDAENSKHYNACMCVENGNNLVCFDDYFGIGKRFNYNLTNGDITDMYRMDNNEIFDYDEAEKEFNDPNNDYPQISTAAADIDPLTKTWCVVGGNYYLCSSFSDLKIKELKTTRRLGGAFLCCWSETLKRFCICGRQGTFLVNINGQITAESEKISFLSVVLDYYFSIAWSPELQIFLVTLGKEKVAKSADGINWDIYTPDLPNLPDATSKTLTGVSWIPMLNAFIASVCYQTKSYVYTSKDGRNWQYLSEFSWSNVTISNINPILRTIYLPKQKLILMIGTVRSFLSNNGQDWIELKYGPSILTQGYAIWSETLKTAVYLEHAQRGSFAKLIID